MILIAIIELISLKLMNIFYNVHVRKQPIPLKMLRALLVLGESKKAGIVTNLQSPQKQLKVVSALYVVKKGSNKKKFFFFDSSFIEISPCILEKNY